MMDVVNYKDCIDAHKILERDDISGFFRREQMSASRIKKWEQCPASAIINECVPAVSDALTVGTVVHALLEKMVNENMEMDAVIAGIDEFSPVSLNDFQKRNVIEYLRSYEKIEPYSELAMDSLTEVNVESVCAPLNVTLPVPLKGFIDRIDVSNLGTCIVDYKTGKRKLKKDQYIDQMIIYKWLYEECFGQEVLDCYVCSLFKGDPEYQRQEITLVKQSKLIDRIFDVNAELEESLNTGCFKKKRGWWCRWCPYCNNCFAGNNTSNVNSNPFM